MSEWRSQGKQVLQDGRHFADAAGELEAMMIVNAMRALGEASKHRGGTVAPPVRRSLVGGVARGAALCRPMREQDEYVCSKCGVRWDVREPAPRCGRAP